METVKTVVIVAKIQTMADGGLRFIFDAAETETFAAAQFMECKRFGIVGELTFVPIDKEIDKDEGIGTIKGRKAKRRKQEGNTSL